MLQGIQNQLSRLPLQQQSSLVAYYPTTYRENQKQNIQSDRFNEIPQEISPTPIKLTNPRQQLFELLSKNPNSFDLQLKPSAGQSQHNQQYKENNLQSSIKNFQNIQNGNTTIMPPQSKQSSSYSSSSDRSFPSYGWQLKRQQLAIQKPRHQPLSIKKRPSFPLSFLVDTASSSIGRRSVQTSYPRVYDKQIAKQFQYPEKVNDFVIEPSFELLPFEGFQQKSQIMLSQQRFVNLFGGKETYREDKIENQQKQIQSNKIVLKEELLPQWMHPPKQQMLNSQQVLNNLKKTNNNNIISNEILQLSNRQSFDKKIHKNMNNDLQNQPSKISNFRISLIEELQFSQIQKVAIHMEKNQSEYVPNIVKEEKNINCFVSLPKQPTIKSYFSKRQSLRQQRYSEVPLNKIDVYR